MSSTETPSPPPANPDWLRALLRGIGRDGVQPRDPSVQRLWTLLRDRRLLARSAWLKLRLRQIWAKGLPAKLRPRTVRQVRALLRRFGLLAPRAGAQPQPALVPPALVQTTVITPRPRWGPVGPSPGRPIGPLHPRPPSHPIVPLRPLQPVRPVRLQPMGTVRPVGRLRSR